MMTFNVRKFYDSHVAEDVQGSIVRHIVRGYISADKLVKNSDYQLGPAKNLYPYVRWAQIDDNCLALNKHDGVETYSAPNVIRNSFHTLILSGNVVMTVSAVKSPTDLPRDALYRNEHASSQHRFDINPETGMFEIADPPSVGDRLYAFVLHGPTDRDNPRVPGFIRVVFPDKGCTKPIDQIDLYERFSDVVQEVLSEGTEVIGDKADVKLKLKTDVQGELKL